MKKYLNYDLLIVGSGQMARDYSLVIKDLKKSFFVVGNSERSTKLFTSEIGIEAISGGIENFLDQNSSVPKLAIVCTPVETLYDVTNSLLDSDVEDILIEKPGPLYLNELKELSNKASRLNKNVFIAYNRRFYESILKLEDLLVEETLIGVNFELTEWSHTIDTTLLNEVTLQHWFISNTSHVVDLVMHIAGPIKELSSYSSGKLDWHKAASRFSGSGFTSRNILISYSGYWDGPGRWSIDFITKENRYILRPLERLQHQKIGSIDILPVDGIDYSLEENFKPGLYKQVFSFMAKDYSKFCTLEEQISSLKIYNKMAGYKSGN